MAARAYTVDEVFLSTGWIAIRARYAFAIRDTKLYDERRWSHLQHALLGKQPRVHRPGCGQAMGLFGDNRCRPVLGAARIPSLRQGSHLHRLQRSARSSGTGLAPRIAPQAGPGALSALPT